MFGYLVRRIIAALSVLIMVSIATFGLFFLGPSDPAASLCGTRNCTPERYEQIKKSLGLDEPKVQQYLEFAGGIFTGRELHSGAWVKECPAPCFGYSFNQDRPVTNILMENVPVTLSIAAGGLSLTVVIGVSIGVFAALNRGRPVDKILVGFSLTLSSVPYYIVAVLAFLTLAVQLQIFPRTGYHPLFEEGPIAWASGLLLAWVVMGFYNSTQYARFSRASMVEALSEDFVRTARAKGLSARRVNLRHALRAGLAPVVTIFGLDIGSVVGGLVFTEFIFDLKGLGRLALDSVTTGDLPVIMGTVLMAAIGVITMNIIVDLVYGVIDPRVRLA